ncbi:MAG TPA: DUF58 domain-containing protein [Fimbriimonadaceae bacterium]|nr:DUF58 domain-containing protein [Fimbriimonadaceae bacterium]HRJ33133.1 DUF58 domain-containing protein [Fimbriimonadaceae bacterium]
MIVPTRKTLWLFAAGFLLAPLAFWIPGAERLLWAYNGVLLILVVGSSRLVPPASAISIQRRFDPVLSNRVENWVHMTLANESPVPLRGRIRDEAPEGFGVEGNERDFSISPGKEAHWSYKVRPFVRGPNEFRGTYVRLKAPLGLCEVDRRIDPGQPLRVYPSVLALKEFELLKQRGRLNLMGIRKARIKGLGTEFQSLRDYQDDDYRRIDWKASARRNKLVVRDYEVERNQAVLVCLDVGRRMLSEVDGVAKIDFMLDAALMLVHAANVGGDQTGLIVFSDAVKRYVPPKKGRHQSGVILDTIHALLAEPVESNYQAAMAYLGSRWKRRSLVVVFTDAENDDQARDLVAALSPIAKRHLVFVVRVSDPRLKEMAELQVTGMDNLYQKAASSWYFSERRQADSRLRAANLQSIEAEPQDLSAALVTAYLHAKATHAI